MDWRRGRSRQSVCRQVVAVAQGVLDTSSDTRVKALASAIIDGQKKEIATMQGLLG